jgi:hypothetical protein
MNNTIPEQQEQHLRDAWEHARTSHANIQETIKFLDTKSGIITGLVSISAALPISVLHWIATTTDSKLLDKFSCYECLGKITFLLILASIAFAAATIVYSIRSLLARTAPGESTLLFAIHPANPSQQLRKKLDQLPEGLPLHEILKEYSNQLYDLGAILYLKGVYHRHSAACFQWQIALILIAISLIGYIGWPFY